MSPWVRLQKVNPTVAWFADQCIEPDIQRDRVVGYDELFTLYQKFAAIIDTPDLSFQNKPLFIFHLRVLLPWHFQKRRRVTQAEKGKGVKGEYVPAHFCKLKLAADLSELKKGNLNKFRRLEMRLKVERLSA